VLLAAADSGGRVVVDTEVIAQDERPRAPQSQLGQADAVHLSGQNPDEFSQTEGFWPSAAEIWISESKLGR
jgi:hypothetical protein